MLDDAWSLEMRKRLDIEEHDNEVLYSPPSSVTGPAQRFYDELAVSISVLLVFLSSATFANNAQLVASSIIASFKSPSAERPPIKKVEDPFKLGPDADGPFVRQMNRLSPVLTTMALTRIVDNFTSYISEVVGECLRASPETMRSKEQVTLETVFRASSLEELHEMLVDRKVNELAYLGFEKLADWIDVAP